MHKEDSFQIQIASDLHIEYKNNEVPDPLDYITPVAPNLAPQCPSASTQSASERTVEFG